MCIINLFLADEVHTISELEGAMDVEEGEKSVYAFEETNQLVAIDMDPDVVLLTQTQSYLKTGFLYLHQTGFYHGFLFHSVFKLEPPKITWRK